MDVTLVSIGQFLTNVPWVLSLIYLLVVLIIMIVVIPMAAEARDTFNSTVTSCSIAISVLEAAAVFVIWRHSADPLGNFLAFLIWIKEICLIIRTVWLNGTNWRPRKLEVTVMLLAPVFTLVAGLIMAFGR